MRWVAAPISRVRQLHDVVAIGRRDEHDPRIPLNRLAIVQGQQPAVIVGEPQEGLHPGAEPGRFDFKDEPLPLVRSKAVEIHVAAGTLAVDDHRRRDRLRPLERAVVLDFDDAGEGSTPNRKGADTPSSVATRTG